MHLVNDYRKADVVIHNGKFHADEMLALQFYEKAVEKDIAVIRLSEIPKRFKGVCIDVGDGSGRDDLLIFDHHGSLEERRRDNRAACGKVFDEYKEKILPKMFKDCDPALVEQVFRNDVLSSIQSQDNLGTPHISSITYKDNQGKEVDCTTNPFSFASAVHKLNPNYQSEDKADEKFVEAYDYAKEVVDAYCNSLTQKVQQGIVKSPADSNFNSRDFECKNERLDKNNYSEYSNILFYNLRMAKRGVNAFHDQERQFLIGDIFSMGKTEVAEKFLDKVCDGYKDFEKGFHDSVESIGKQIEEINKTGDGVLVLDSFKPWNNPVLRANRSHDMNLSIDLVVFPSQRAGRWNVQTVLDRSDNGTYRVNMPKEAQGLSESELSQHAKGLCFMSNYMAAFNSKEDAVNFAEKLIAEQRRFIIPEGCKDTSEIKIPPVDKATIRSVEIPEGLTNISPNTFQYCHNLKEVSVPPNVDISRNGFSNCKRLEKVTIEPGLPYLKAFSFSDCPKIKEVNLPDTLKRFNPLAFKGCDNIEKVNIKMTSFNNIKNVVTIGNSFPNAEVTVDCSDIGHETFTYNELKDMLIEANSRIVGKEDLTTEKDSLETLTEIAEQEAFLFEKETEKTTPSTTVSVGMEM